MRFIVPVVLLLVAVIHALPVTGVAGASKLSSLYGVSVQDPNLEILLRHRAVLFGLLAALLAWCAFHPHLHRLGLVAAIASTLSFVVIAQLVGSYNTAVALIVRADLLALSLLAVGSVVHIARPAGS